MTDIASLGIEVDTRQLQDGAKAMDTMGEASVRLDQKVGSLNGQMNDTAEIMRRNAAAADVASEATKRILDPLRQEIDLFGASRGEIERYRASKAGLSAAAQREAQALGDAIAAMQRDEQAAREVAKAQDDAARAAGAFMQKLNDQVATLGMNTQQLQAYRAAQLGVSDAAAPLIARLGEAGSAAHGAGGHLDGLSFSSANAKREVLVLAHELSQGNFSRFGSSMMVLGEQTGAASLLFSGAGVAALGLAAAVGGVAYEMIKGAAEQKHMDDALIMTGNYAGITSDSLNDLAHAAVAAGGSIGEAKKVATELAASGKYSAEQIGTITEATVAWEHATGKSVQGTIKEFESLAVQTQGSSLRATEAISKATLKLDDTYHFLTESVYEQIRALEKEGDAKAASALATDTFAKVTKDRADQVIENLGYVAKSWNAVKEAIGGATDAVGNWGKKATPASEVERLQKEIGQIDSGSYAAIHGGDSKSYDSRTLAAIRASDITGLNKAALELLAVDAQAAKQRDEDIKQSEASHAASRILQDDAKLEKKGMSELQIAIRGYGEDLAKIAAANKDSPLLTQDAVNEHMAALIKAHSPKESTKGQDDRAKVLADALGNEQAALDSEKSIYDAREKMLTVYHQKFATSDADYYAGREAARADYIAAEAITYAKEQALVKASLDAAKNPQEVAAAKGKYDQLAAAHQKFVDDMRNVGGDDRLAVLADQKKVEDDYLQSIGKAGQAALKSLDDQIAKEAEHGREIGKSKAEIDAMKQAQQDAATVSLQNQEAAVAGLLQQNDLNAEARKIYDEVLLQLHQQIAARQELAGILGSNAIRQADADAAKAASDAWNSTAKHVETTLADAIVNGGGNAWKKLKTSIVSQALSVPINFVGSLAASILNPTAAQAGSTNILGAAGSISSAVNLATGSAAASIGNGLSSIGGYFGSSSLAEFGSGFSGASSAEALAATLAGDTVPALSAAATAGSTLAAAFSTAIPWVAAAGAAFKVWNTFFEDGPEQNTHLTFGSNNAAGNISINERGNEGKNSAYIDNYGTSSLGTFGVTNSLWMSSSSDVVQSFIKTVSQTDDALATFMTAAEKASVSSYLTGKSETAQTGAEGSNPNAAGALDKVLVDRINNILEGVEPGLSSLESGFTGTTQQLATEAAALLQYRVALKDSGQALFGTEVTLQQIAALKQPTEATSAALTRVANEFQATNQVTSMFGVDSAKAFGAAGLASEAARAQVILLSGGLSAFTSQASDYAQNYLTDAERLAPVAKQLDAALAGLGLTTIPQTKDEFKALMDQLVSSGSLATEQGAKQFAGLMSLESAFAQVHVATDDAAQMLQLQADMFAANGDKAGAASVLLQQHALALKDLTPSIAAATKATWDAQAAEKARSDASAEATSILDQQAQMYAATGDKTGAAAVLLAQHQAALVGLTPALAAATEATWAAQAAQKVIADATTEHDAVLSQMADLYAATGDKAAAAAVLQQQHQAALAGLTPAVAAATQAAWEAQAAQKSMADATSEHNAILTQLAALYVATGDKAAAAAVLEQQHNAALVGLTPALAAATQATWDAQAAEQAKKDALTESNSKLAIQAQIYEITGQKAEAAMVVEQQRAAALALLSPALQVVTKELWALQDAAANNSGMATLGSALTDSITAAQKAAKAFRDLNDSLLTGESSALSPEQKYAEAKRQFQTADGTHLEAAEKAFLEASKAWFGGSAGYATDFAAVIAKNNEFADSSDAQAAAIPGIWALIQKQMGIGAHAAGGIADGWSLVGEQGPEIVNFSQPGRVYTASQSREMMGGSSSSASMERTNLLLEAVLSELRADKTQRGAVASATLDKLDTVADKLEANKRAIARKETA